MKKIPITKDNLIFAHCELDFTHDHSTVVEGSIMFDRTGAHYEVTKIVVDNSGNRHFWSGELNLGQQYRSPHNMLTKEPYYAHEYKVVFK